MTFQFAHPQALAGMAAQSAAAAAAIVHSPRGVDDVSGCIAPQFSAHVAGRQTVGAQTMAVREPLTTVLRASASSHTATGIANTTAAY